MWKTAWENKIYAPQLACDAHSLENQFTVLWPLSHGPLPPGVHRLWILLTMERMEVRAVVKSNVSSN